MTDVECLSPPPGELSVRVRSTSVFTSSCVRNASTQQKGPGSAETWIAIDLHAPAPLFKHGIDEGQHPTLTAPVDGPSLAAKEPSTVPIYLVEHVVVT